MFIRKSRIWAIPDSEVTDERSYLSRRRFLQTTGAAAVLLAAGAPAQEASQRRRNERYTLDRPLTEEAVAARHNIFDEFALERDKVWIAARNFVTSPWKIHIGGQVRKHRTVDVSHLVQAF